jgi:uncharacterized protein YjbI with pentapeptide repeats
MKRKLLTLPLVFLGTTTAIALLSTGCTTQAQVQELLKTKECPGCTFERANLERLDLRNVNLEGANLESANLRGASLANANLRRANLQHADLENADLGCTAFSLNLRAETQGSNLKLKVEATPEEPDPTKANPGVNLNAHEQGATLKLNLGGCANLQDAQLTGAKMPDGSIHR